MPESIHHLKENDRVYPAVEEIQKEAERQLSLAFREFQHLGTSGSFHSVLNLPGQKGLFEHNLREVLYLLLST